MSINTRLREVMEYKSLNIKAFAELLDVPYRTLQNYLLNERDPSAELLIKVSDVFNVDLNWLMRGQGEMFRDSMSESTLNEKEKQLISHYREMPMICRSLLISLLNSYLESRYRIELLHIKSISSYLSIIIMSLFTYSNLVRKYNILFI